MRKIINTPTPKTRGATSGKLANAIKIWRDPNTEAQIHWGIGDINKLQQQVPYWYVVNYGKTTRGQPYIPNFGNFVPGFFLGGDGRPIADLAGKGKERFGKLKYSGSGMFPKTAIRPINFIEKTRFKLNQEIQKLLNKLKRQ